MTMHKRIYELVSGNQEMVIATIVDVTGSTPGRQSFRMLVFPDGKTEGTVGGGALEHKVTEKALRCLKEASSSFEELNLEKLGMACGGAVKVFYEYVSPQKNLYIFGGGHLGQAVTPMAVSLGFSVTVVDNREEVARLEVHPHAREVIFGDYGEKIRAMRFGTPAWALIFSHKHNHDEEILRELLKKDIDFQYIGMIGSRKKVKGTFEKIAHTGVAPEKFEKVFSPVGIDIGADTPNEIAISILAEIIALEKKKAVTHMRMKSS